jgi:hypothetical protein
MTTTETTSSIDDKKAENSGEDTDKKADYFGFFTNFVSSVLFSICLGVIVIGSIGLYYSKISQLNILPTDINYYPYTDDKPDSKTVKEVHMNYVKGRSFYGLGIWAKPLWEYCQNATFETEPFEEGFEKSWVRGFKKSAKPGKFTSNFYLFMSETLNRMLANSFSFLSGSFYYTNYFPEWIVILLFSVIFPIYIYIFYMYNFLLGIISHISNMSYFFRNSTSSDDTENTGFSFFNFLWFIFLWLWVSLISIFLSPIFITFYTLFKPLSLTYELDGSNEKKGFGTFLIDSFIYKRTFIIALSVLSLFRLAGSYLGNSFLPSIVIAVILLAVVFNIFNPTKPDIATQIDVTNKKDDKGSGTAKKKKNENKKTSEEETVDESGEESGEEKVASEEAKVASEEASEEAGEEKKVASEEAGEEANIATREAGEASEKPTEEANVGPEPESGSELQQQVTQGPVEPINPEVQVEDKNTETVVNNPPTIGGKKNKKSKIKKNKIYNIKFM